MAMPRRLRWEAVLSCQRRTVTDRGLGALSIVSDLERLDVDSEKRNQCWSYVQAG